LHSENAELIASIRAQAKDLAEIDIADRNEDLSRQMQLAIDLQRFRRAAESARMTAEVIVERYAQMRAKYLIEFARSRDLPLLDFAETSEIFLDPLNLLSLDAPSTGGDDLLRDLEARLQGRV
jgi:hypothetical protein